MVRTLPPGLQGAHAGFLLSRARAGQEGHGDTGARAWLAPNIKMRCPLLISLGSQTVLWEFHTGLWAVVVRKMSSSVGSERQTGLGSRMGGAWWEASVRAWCSSSRLPLPSDAGMFWDCFPPTRG